MPLMALEVVVVVIVVDGILFFSPLCCRYNTSITASCLPRVVGTHALAWSVRRVSKMCRGRRRTAMAAELPVTELRVQDSFLMNTIFLTHVSYTFFVEYLL